MKIDMHCHSSYSADGNLSVEALLSHAKKIGLDGIAIMDHNEIKGSLKACKIARELNLVAVRGTEISSRDGHILAYGISETVPKGLSSSETLEHVERLGGLAVAAHPFRWYTGVKKKVLLSNKFSAFEARNGRSLSMTNKSVERLASQRGLGITGGSDAHKLAEVGRAITIFNESYEKEEDLIEAVIRKKTRVDGTGRPLISSIRYAAKCVGGWFKRGMKRI